MTSCVNVSPGYLWIHARLIDGGPSRATDVSRFKPLFEAYAAQDLAEVWNVHVSDKVSNPSVQRQMVRGHGKM
jgi:hypothetical protein